jgi:hypothetical protein
MQWAYRLAIFRDVLALAVFGGGYALANMMVLNGENRAVMAVMLGTLLILNAMWQAAGLLLARFQTVGLRGRTADRARIRRVPSDRCVRIEALAPSRV